MALVLLAALWLLTFFAAALGWRLGARSKTVATALAVLAGLGLVGGAWIARHLSWLPEWAILPLTAYLHGSWFAPPGAFLFLLAARQAQEREKAAAGLQRPAGRSSARRTVLLLVLLTGVVLIAASNPLLGPPDIEKCEADLANTRVDTDNVVRQTTNYTCGPAACATLLRRTGLDPEATESEMVPLCLTKRWGGASTLGMAVGLKKKVAPLGWHVRIVEPDWEAFKRLRKPALCAMSYLPFINHAVVVCAVEEGRVQVADPIAGLSCWPENEFRKMFRNEAVVVFRKDPQEADR
ncbi:MAG: cysteine peptidase family C39 domain-containing protein [Planctomycetota bacterium]